MKKFLLIVLAIIIFIAVVIYINITGSTKSFELRSIIDTTNETIDSDIIDIKNIIESSNYKELIHNKYPQLSKKSLDKLTYQVAKINSSNLEDTEIVIILYFKEKLHSGNLTIDEMNQMGDYYKDIITASINKKGYKFLKP